MALSPTKWETIRFAYETQNRSQHTLALEHGVSQAAISKRARKGGWVVKSVVTPVLKPTVDNLPDPDTITTPAIAAKLLQHIAKIVKEASEPLDPREIKLLTDSLSQIYKIEIMAAAHEKPTESGIDVELMKYLDMEQLQILAEHRSRMDAILEVGPGCLRKSLIMSYFRKHPGPTSRGRQTWVPRLSATGFSYLVIDGPGSHDVPYSYDQGSTLHDPRV